MAGQQQQGNLAFYYVTGPVHVYIRIPSKGAGPFVPPNVGGNILFLGHAEVSPEPDFEPQYIPVMSSLGGPVVEDDEIYAGGKYKLSINLARFSWDVIQLLNAFPAYGRQVAPGTETYLDRGRLVQAQGDSFEVWTRNSTWGTPNAVAYPNLPIGYYFPGCRVMGTSPRKLTREAVQCLLHIKPLSIRQGITGGFLTYSQDPSFFQQLPEPG